MFFDEAGYGISHVGIATGYGTVIHASTYYGAIVETPIEYIPGYVGAVDAYSAKWSYDHFARISAVVSAPAFQASACQAGGFAALSARAWERAS